VIILEIDTDCEEVEAAVRSVEGVEQVSSHGNEVTIMVKDGAATISPVAVALHEANLQVRNLTLRTPTLDDVFLELTGGRIEETAR
jgi:ABC-2 type transport system ATP-binding protein